MSWAWVCGLEPHNSGTPELQSKRGSEEEEEEEEEVEEKKNVPSERCMNGGAPGPQAGGGRPRASAMRCYAAPCYAMLWCAICGAGLAPSAAERVPFPARIRATPPRSVPFSSTPRDSTPPRSSSVLRAPRLSGARGAASVRISGRSGARGATLC